MKFKDGIKERNIIVKCGADMFLPFALLFGIYIILFGTVSPGGGFQGGVMVASAALLLYLGYGYNYFRATNIEVTQNSDGTYKYSRIEPDSVVDIIVEKDVAEANAVNNVAAIVFDFRGFDTLGESFILLTAIAGSFVILARNKKVKKEDKTDEV